MSLSDRTATYETVSIGKSDGRPWGVTVLGCPDASLVGRVIPVASECAIGRRGGDGLDLAIADGSMSRRHAVIVRRAPTRFTIRDEGSRNGTFVDGERIGEHEVAAPALIRIGETVLELGPLPEAHEEDLEQLIGRSPAFRAMIDDASRAASASLPILLLGDTGTGKEVLAQYLHRAMQRAGPFVAVNMAAIPATLVESYLFGHKKGAFTGAVKDSEGYFKAAHGGTIFLDEVAELPLDLQPKLLRLLETFELTPIGGQEPTQIDVQVISATNADLRREVDAGSFRRDLYARLAGSVIRLPPLRERRTDVPLLAAHFLKKLGANLTFSTSALEALLLHRWPMNVRELKMAMARAASLGEPVVHFAQLSRVLELDHETPEPPPRARREPERPSQAELEEAFAAEGGTVTRVAQRFGKDPRQIYRWLRHYGIDADRYR